MRMNESIDLLTYKEGRDEVLKCYCVVLIRCCCDEGRALLKKKGALRAMTTRTEAPPMRE